MVFATGEYGGDGKIAYRLAKESDIEAICDLIKSAITVMENNSISSGTAYIQLSWLT